MLFCDLDGVLADLDKHYFDCFGVETSKTYDNVDWQKVKNTRNFYYHIPLMPDAQELWEYIERYKPTILTGVPEYLAEEATKNKIEWVAKNFGTDVPVITCKSKDKSLHAKPGDIIIDDWEKYKHKWVAIGGIWITHVNAKQSIKELKQHIKE